MRRESDNPAARAATQKAARDISNAMYGLQWQDDQTSARAGLWTHVQVKVRRNTIATHTMPF